jgi:hypothetical protein
MKEWKDKITEKDEPLEVNGEDILSKLTDSKTNQILKDSTETH